MRALRILLVAFIVLPFSYCVLRAATINVPADYLTIQAAIVNASEGDTVLIADGDYEESFDFTTASITLRSANGPGVTSIKGYVRMAYQANNASHIEGFTFKEASSKAVEIFGKNKPTISNCIFVGNNRGLSCSTDSATIVDCSFISNTIALLLSSSHETLVKDCLFYDNGSLLGYTIYMLLSGNVAVQNCLLAQNAGYSVYARQCSSIDLTNLTVADTKLGAGIYYSESDGTLSNSIVASNGTYGGVKADGGSILTATYNNVWNNQIFDYDSVAVGIGSISQDPQFSGPGRLDYTLQAGSPCIDAGNPAPIYNDPDASRNDMGAFYFGSISPDWDKDGAPAATDNCSLVYNPDQNNYDSDSLGNACDNCLLVSNVDQQDIDGDGIGTLCDNCEDSDGDGLGDPGVPTNSCETDLCPSLFSLNNTDTDADGVGDVCDNCPNDYNPDQVDLDHDGLGDVCDVCIDIDGDGFGDPWIVPNGCPPDNCPYYYNPGQEDTDGDGRGDICDNEGCCGQYTWGMSGNVDCSEDGKINLADITKLIDHVYISKDNLCCNAEANCDGDILGKTGLADITKLIDHVYISKTPTAPCL